MRPAPKKKKTKKKAATKTRPKKVSAPTAPTDSDSDEFDDWAARQKQQSGCVTCRDDVVNGTIRALLKSLIRKRAYKFSVQELRRVIEARHPDADVGQRGLERHLRTCERVLYFRARGRRDV